MLVDFSRVLQKIKNAFDEALLEKINCVTPSDEDV